MDNTPFPTLSFAVIPYKTQGSLAAGFSKVGGVKDMISLYFVSQLSEFPKVTSW